MAHGKNTNIRIEVSEGVFAYEPGASRTGMMLNVDDVEEKHPEDEELTEMCLRGIVRSEIRRILNIT